jgi:type II secretory pathway pseudopilin PulG
MKKRHDSARGFSLVELLVGTVMFTIITGAVFSLLMSAQLRYRGESNVTETFQQANVALDQITRDVHSAGYPPKNSVSINVATNTPDKYALPFAWTPNYPAAPCTVAVGGSCTVPGDYDLIVEADVSNGNGVQWIRYSLQDTTLMRGMATKVPFRDPVDATTGSLVPYLENVVNRNNFVPIFSYTYDRGAAPQPSNIREVNISLMVRAPQPDPQTRQFRTITLTGQAVRFNPNQ